MGDVEYWFDAAPLLTDPGPPARPAFTDLRDRWAGDRSVKGRMSSLRSLDAKALLKDALIPDRPRPLEEFAKANGLDFRAWQRKSISERPSASPGECRPGLLFDGTEARDIVSWEGWPSVEFGNLWLYGGEQWGYVALRHGLPIPHVVLDAKANDAPATKGRRTTTSLTRRESGAGVAPGARRTKVDRLKGKVAALDLGAEAERHLRAWCEIGREEQARGLLAGAALQVVCETSLSFDLEITDSWVFLYGYDFDVSTTEPERWAWIFSLTSRWCDVIHAWADGSQAPADPAVMARRPPFYTEQAVGRPRSLAELPRVPHDGAGSGVWDQISWLG